MEQLFTQALGLTAPWAVTGFDFRPAESAIHFTAECEATRLPCPACGAADQPIHDRLARRWQHLHFFQFKAYIKARVPRVACSQRKKTSHCEVPWSRPGSGFSAVMEAFVIALCQGMPVAQVARQIQTMHHLQRSGLQTARACRMKEALRQIFRDANTRTEAEPLLRGWISWAQRCRLAPFKWVGQKLKDHFEASSATSAAC